MYVVHDHAKVRELMGKSFAFRRMEINRGLAANGLMLVSGILDRWPALKIKSYVNVFRIIKFIKILSISVNPT